MAHTSSYKVYPYTRYCLVAGSYYVVCVFNVCTYVFIPAPLQL